MTYDFSHPGVPDEAINELPELRRRIAAVEAENRTLREVIERVLEEADGDFWFVPDLQDALAKLGGRDDG